MTGAITEVLPGYLRNPAPPYPLQSRSRGEEGTVVVRVEILPSGRCGTVATVRSSGYARLDQAAVQAVRRWVFKPAVRWSHPIELQVEIPITFRLTDHTGRLQ